MSFTKKSLLNPSLRESVGHLLLLNADGLLDKTLKDRFFSPSYHYSLDSNSHNYWGFSRQEVNPVIENTLGEACFSPATVGKAFTWVKLRLSSLNHICTLLPLEGRTVSSFEICLGVRSRPVTSRGRKS